MGVDGHLQDGDDDSIYAQDLASQAAYKAQEHLTTKLSPQESIPITKGGGKHFQIQLKNHRFNLSKFSPLKVKIQPYIQSQCKCKSSKSARGTGMLVTILA